MTDNTDIVKGLYEAFGKGDVPGVLGAFDSAIEWWVAEGFRYAEGNPYVGPQAIAEGVFMRIVGDVEGFTVVPEKITDGGERVFAEGRYRGTVKSTGAPVNAQFIHVWTLKGGKVFRFQQYTDTAQWDRAFAV